MTNIINAAIPISLYRKYIFYDISLEPICKEHLQELASDLRPEDQQELWACYHGPVVESLAYCWQVSSYSWCMRYRGKTVAIASVEPVSLLGNQACMWSWTGKEIEKCPVSFWKISKAILLFCRQIYPCLYAACDSRYTVAQQYLKRLGAIRHKEPLYLADKQIHFDVYQFTFQCK